MLRDALLVSLGGALGSLARWGLVLLLPATPGRPPLGTLLVNVAGCLAIGAFVEAAAAREWLGAARPFVVTGLLGGFTTFSAFGWETYALAGPQRAPGAAALTVALHVGLGLLAVWAGARLAAPLFAR